MSDKENESNNINQSEEFQTFHKNIKDSNKNSNKGQNSISRESNEFTFKKNLFNIRNIKNQDSQQTGHFIQENSNNNINSKSMLINDNNNYIENKTILRVLFQKDKKTINDNIFNTVIINNYNNKGKKLPNNSHNKCNNNKYNNSFLNPKLKKNIKNEKYKSNYVIYKDMNKNKSPLINKNTFNSKNVNNSKQKSIKKNKNSSFISQKNKLNINQNDFISSYRAKIKKNISSKSINSITENNKIYYNGKNLKNIKISNQKSISYNNNINKEKKEKEKEKEKSILKKCNKNKMQLNKMDNNSLTLNNNYKNINKNKLEKTPLSCKNQVYNFCIKEYNHKNYQIKSNPFISLKKLNNVNTNSSISIKKNRTFLNLNNKNKRSSFIKSKNESKIKKKLTPDKKNISILFNKNK